MARRPRLFAPGVLYHVIVRGNQRQETFVSDGDYQAYLERLGRYRKKYGYVVHGYCLMPNHVHLLLESSEHPLAKFMQGLQQSYTQYFNLKHHKTGHLFEGRYKAIICQKDEYLLELIRYIHLNPVRAGMVRNVEEYRYCGHYVYIQGKATEIIDPTKVLSILGGKGAYRRFVQDGVGEGHKEQYYEVEDQRFGERMLRIEAKEELRPPKRKSLDKVARELARLAGVETQALRSGDRSWAVSRARTMIAYVLVRRLEYKLGEVAAYFGRDIATVASLLARLSERLQSDVKQAGEIERFAKTVDL